MTARHLISLLAISLLSTVEAKAGSAPQQLRGKSITLSWSESGVYKRDGSSLSVTYNLVRVIYISEAGRAFGRATTTGRRGSMTKEAGPEQTAGRFDFAGNTPNDRAWVRSIFESADADHVLHYILMNCAKRDCVYATRLSPEDSITAWLPKIGSMRSRDISCRHQIKKSFM